jgi:hypothetical protein
MIHSFNGCFDIKKNIAVNTIFLAFISNFFHTDLGCPLISQKKRFRNQRTDLGCPLLSQNKRFRNQRTDLGCPLLSQNKRFQNQHIT